MRLKIDDGYTLKARTSPSWSEGLRDWANLPVVEYEYRPALPDAIYDWQVKTTRAMTGKEQLDATAELIASHLTSWDVVGKPGTLAVIEADTVRRVPYPILQQILARVTTWAAQMDADAKK